jgi:hypothetical protein
MEDYLMSHKSKLAVVLGLVLMTFFADSSYLYSQGGESAVPFLLISPTSKSSGMGESGTGLADDASAIFWNPGGLAFQEGREISLTHTNWLPQFHQSDLFYEYLNCKWFLQDIGTLSGSITYLNLGEFIRTTSESPDEVSRWKSYEYAVTIGYSTKVLDELGLGINLRYIHSALSPLGTEQEKGDGIASIVSGDIGLLYKPQSLVIPLTGIDLGNILSIGFNLSNLGPKLTYIDAAQADPLPTNLRLGFGAKILESDYNNLTYTLDFSRLLVRRYTEEGKPPDEFYKALITAWGDGGLRKVVTSTGFEYWYGKPRLIALRFGYLYEDPSYGNRKFLTFGAGVRYDVYGFDFSYISTFSDNSPLANTLRFSLVVNW